MFLLNVCNFLLLGCERFEITNKTAQTVGIEIGKQKKAKKSENILKEKFASFRVMVVPIGKFFPVC